MGNNTYCEKCVNGGTGTCRICRCIVSPSGKESEPSEFVPAVSGATHLGKLRTQLTFDLLKGASLELAQVMAYNRLLALESEGK